MFSFVIPTHNPKYLQYTIQSLLNLNFPQYHYEVIVVENPTPTHRVLDVMKNLPDNFKLLYCPTMGANAARNFGIKAAKYEHIILTDDDCEITPNYLINLSDTINRFNVEMIGGPLICKFICDKPKWIVGGFLANLSEINFAPNIKIPFDINLINGMYLVSANLYFTKNLYNRIGPFEEEHGYIGNGLFANDEVRFINRARKNTVMYDPRLIINHITGPERCKLEYFIQRRYSQGYVDAVLYLESKTDIDVYNNEFTWNCLNAFTNGEIYSVREEIKNEDITREWVRAKIITDTAYKIGMIHRLEGKDKCENICSLLMNESDVKLYSRS